MGIQERKHSEGSNLQEETCKEAFCREFLERGIFQVRGHLAGGGGWLNKGNHWNKAFLWGDLSWRKIKKFFRRLSVRRPLAG